MKILVTEGEHELTILGLYEVSKEELEAVEDLEREIGKLGQRQLKTNRAGGGQELIVNADLREARLRISDITF